MVEIDFDPNTYEKPSFGDPLPSGWYTAVVTKTELMPTKAGDGQYLEVTFQVDKNAHPDHGGRNLWERLNLYNKNEKTQAIARGQLRKLQECCGKPVIRNTEELHGCAVLAKVVMIPAQGEYPAKNEIKDYKPIGSAVPASPTAPAMAGAPAAASAAAPSNVPAWMRKS